MNLKAIFLCGLLTILCLPGLMVIIIWSISKIDTSIYAPGFSEDLFQQIEIGMPKESVHALLGTPISQQQVDSPETWSYSKMSVKRGWIRTTTDPGESRYIQFDALARVVRVRGDSLRKLIREGMEQQEVLAILGEPTEVYPQTTEVLHYSSPADWGTYRARIIGIDSNGLVSEITTYDMPD